MFTKSSPQISHKLMEFVLRVLYVFFLAEIYAAWMLRKCSWLIPRTVEDVALYTVFWFEVYIVYEVLFGGGA